VDARLSHAIAFFGCLAAGAELALKRVALAATISCSCNTPGAPPDVEGRCAIASQSRRQPRAVKVHHRCLRPGEETIVTALPLYHNLCADGEFHPYYSIGAEKLAVPKRTRPRQPDRNF